MTQQIRSTRVVTDDGMRPAIVHISGDTITAVRDHDDALAHVPLHEAGDAVVMPGLVDSHVHVNEPGRTEWEGIASATAAAAAGGVTTICDMPLNSIPATTSAASLAIKRTALRGRNRVNVEFIGGVVPGNTDALEGLRDGGVCAFKCFLSPSGVEEFPHVTESDLREAFPVLARLGKALMVHAEDPARLVDPPDGAPLDRYETWLATRPADAERSAIELLVRLMEWCPTPVHIVHLSSATSLPLIRAARARGLPLTVETCPHYLTFAAEEIPDGATEYKCAPPIRDAVERDNLWRALIAGEIDLVASDHSPCPPQMKDTGDFLSAWGGIASLQLSLAAVWSGARARDVGPERIAEWMSTAPARLVGLEHRKGHLRAGHDADVVIWEPSESFMVDPAMLRHRHRVTPYAGRTLWGTVRATVVGGQLAFGRL